MAKTQQRSKRARKNKKSAKFANTLSNLGHPSHINSDDRHAMRNYYEKINSKNEK